MPAKHRASSSAGHLITSGCQLRDCVAVPVSILTINLNLLKKQSLSKKTVPPSGGTVFLCVVEFEPPTQNAQAFFERRGSSSEASRLRKSAVLDFSKTAFLHFPGLLRFAPYRTNHPTACFLKIKGRPIRSVIILQRNLHASVHQTTQKEYCAGVLGYPQRPIPVHCRGTVDCPCTSAS